jgi:hypothetical protein
MLFWSIKGLWCFLLNDGLSMQDELELARLIVGLTDSPYAPTRLLRVRFVGVQMALALHQLDIAHN